ncbi:MAG: imidazoleglycerol-phosphate dehydratase HisB [Blastocatellia bacterium]|nr:MAG: imidazoleglycerol-phosphate dehydratase HisB [Blastocatellia bacterium]
MRPDRHWNRRAHAAVHHGHGRSAVRRAVVDRRTTETQIALSISIDGKGRYQVTTGIRFLDHMLELMARHGGFDLHVDAKGDLDVDQHHTVEDLGIALGEAIAKALGDRRGINRAGYFVMPMDETLAVAAVDLSGRPHAVVDLKVRVARVGDLQSELVHDFFAGFSIGARANVHVKVMYGRSSHHHIEAVFKAFARALRFACSKDRRLAKMLPSTKGLL